MKIRLTKQFVWKECLAMYKWVAARWLLTGTSVSKLKLRWLKAHGYKEGTLLAHCFFCEYDYRRGGDCENCPARLVDGNFYCATDIHQRDKKPVEFYLEMVRLDKIRRKKS